MKRKQLGLEAAVAARRAKGRPAAVAAMKHAMAKPHPKPTHGGRRDGAGRKPNGAKAGERHGVRPFLAGRHPVHVTLRITREVGRLRRRRAYQAFRWALVRVLERVDFRVIHISIQATHVHLICEAHDRMALSKGVRALSISAAHRLNAAVGEERGTGRRKGRVFTDRYNAKVIDSPKQCRNELAYVLNNWRRHREDLAGVKQRRAQVDPYSSAIAFPGWAGREGVPFAWPRGYGALPVSYPTTWLLTEGWRRWGPIALDERPGPRPTGR